MFICETVCLVCGILPSKEFLDFVVVLCQYVETKNLCWKRVIIIFLRLLGSTYRRDNNKEFEGVQLLCFILLLLVVVCR